MIQLQNVSLQRGTQFLLEGADLTLHAGWKVGLIGANGVGKSSLFKLLMNELQTDTGDLSVPAQWQISHMAQEVSSSDRTALDYVLDGDKPLRDVQQAIADAEAKQEHAKIGELHAQLESMDGYSAESRAHLLLTGLGFLPSDASRAVNTFSGGWRIRLNLAQALMCRSDLLLLDEPTNHLDLDATLWLEQWLKQYQGTLILISHDRDFLDNVVGQIVHVYQQQLTLYKGNYSAFEIMRAERLAQQQSAYNKQQQRIGEIENFVRRFRAKATKAKQAQSRLKELARMEKIAPAHVDSPFTFRFDNAEKISTPLVSLQEAQCGYPDAPILNNIGLDLSPGARIGLLGPNGAGKSTLIKTLVGDLALLSGRKEQGEHLQIGYFAQHQLEALDMDASALLHIQRISPKASEQEIRDYLGSFGFLGDDALEPVKRFSGGEKARVALALIAWQKPNLLLMDEPTNHLDLEVRHALTMALQSFEGALILVSHDRHLIRNTVDSFVLVADGKADEFSGDLDDYHAWLSQRKRDEQPAKRETNTSVPTEGRSLSAADRKEQKRLEAEKRKQLSPIKKRIAQLESQMETAQAELDDIEEKMADAGLYEDSRKDELKALIDAQAAAKRTLDDAETEWMEQQEALETLEAELG
ncbi:MAG: ATP-binding cassette domain-containing protein [Pontibacterium sp.]